MVSCASRGTSLCFGARCRTCSARDEDNGAELMTRLLALLTLGTALAGCSSWSVPNLDMSMFSGSTATTVTVRAESNPPGAEARSEGGTACRTPCILALPGSGVSNVTFSLEGYQPQMVPVSITTARESGGMTETGVVEQIRIDPNPVFAQLEVAPPAPSPARRRSAPPKPRAQAAPAPAPAPVQATPQGWGPPPPPHQPVFR